MKPQSIIHHAVLLLGLCFALPNRVGAAPDEFVQIKAGEFQMGDQSNPPVGYFNEVPVHSVFVSTFYIGKHEVTKALWDEVRTWAVSNGYIDLPVGGGRGARHPVHSINWFAMIKWCNARTEYENATKGTGLVPCYTVSGATYKTGDLIPTCNWTATGYRLPTEAEWEKAARAGSSQIFPWGDTISHARANFNNIGGESYQTGTTGNHPTYGAGTAEVGSFAPNNWLLYDMVGNVNERCWDKHSAYQSSSQIDPHQDPVDGDSVIDRGGSWLARAYVCRVSLRGWDSPSKSWDYVGFRLAQATGPVLPQVEITPAEQWINDGRPDTSAPGFTRKQYFRGQTIKLPFKIRNDGDTAVDAKVYVLPARRTSTGHAASWANVAAQAVTLPANGEVTRTFECLVPADAEFGFYDVKAIVELAGDPSVVLDTTEPGAGNTDKEAEAAWIKDELAIDANGGCTTPLDAANPLTNSFMVCQGEPVILVHGIGDNPSSCFGDLASMLTGECFRAVRAFGYTNLTTGAQNPTHIEWIAAAFAGMQVNVNSGIWHLTADTANSVPWTRSFFGGREKVDVIAHSMGGLVSRGYMLGLAKTPDGTPVGYAGEIDDIVTLSTPFYGWNTTTAAYGMANWFNDKPEMQVEQMRCGSAFLHALLVAANSKPEQRSQHIAIAGDTSVPDWTLGRKLDEHDDGVVNVHSSGALSIAGSSMAFGGYAHNLTAAALIGSTDPIMKIGTGQRLTHGPYKWIKAFLTEAPLPTPDRTLQSGDGFDRSALMVRVLVNGSNRGVSASTVETLLGSERMPDLSNFHPIHAFQGCHGELRHDSDHTTFKITLTGGAEKVYVTPSELVVAPIPGGEARAITVYLSRMPDVDNDNLPDDFEVSNGGALGLGDTDGDGFPDYVEMYVGTNPSDPNGKPRVALVPGTPGQPKGTLNIFGAPGVIYTPTSSGDMLTWSQLAQPQVGKGEVLTFPIDVGPDKPKRFFSFQLEVPPP